MKNKFLAHSLLLTALLFAFAFVLVSPASAGCGTIVQDIPTKKCLVGTVYNSSYRACLSDTVGSPCCVGANATRDCEALVGSTPTPPPGITPPANTPTPGAITDPLLNPPGDAFFDMVDPLQHGGGETILDDRASPYANQLKSPGGIVSRLLDFAFPIAGLILFVMLVWAGFEILVGAPSKKSIDAGKQRATAAIIGFLLLFATYWIFQIIETVFGVKIL